MPNVICVSLPVLALSLLAAPSPAQQAPAPAATITEPPVGYTQALPLWPSAAPLAHGTTEGDIPKLFTYPAPGPGPHPAVVVMPGGGYTHLSMEKEGAAEGRWLSAHGVSAFVLEYRLSPAYRFPAPMLDGARAIRYVRANSSTLGVDPGKIGVWGFSAGGHLAGYMATNHGLDPHPADAIDRSSSRPDFAILSYARLSMASNIPRTGSMESILGDQPTQAAIDAIDSVKFVTSDTSPSFIYSTGGDKSVDPLNASSFYEALKRAGVPVELHIFQNGPHGTGMAQVQSNGQPLTPELRELAVFPTLLEHWMEQNGWMPPQS